MSPDYPEICKMPREEENGSWIMEFFRFRPNFTVSGNEFKSVVESIFFAVVQVVKSGAFAEDSSVRHVQNSRQQNSVADVVGGGVKKKPTREMLLWQVRVVVCICVAVGCRRGWQRNKR